MIDSIQKELLHFLQGVGPNAMEKYLTGLTEGHKKWHPFLPSKKGHEESCYSEDPRVRHLLASLDRYVTTLEYVETDSHLTNHLRAIIAALRDPEQNKTADTFYFNITVFRNAIKRREKAIYTLLSSGLSCLECQRLDEAITCFQNDCYLSTTVMAVSAVESRLHYLFSAKDKKLYAAKFKNATLGKLIEVFSPSQNQPLFKKFEKIIPEKHLPLLRLFNVYRILSAHPKITSLDRKVASSILNLTFSFLLDSEIKIKNKKLLHHQSGKK